MDNLDLILLNGLRLEQLTEFELHAGVDQPLVTYYGVIGAFPNKQSDAPENTMSNKAYPLRISVGANADDVLVIYMSRPIGLLKEIYVRLFMHEGKPKRILRLTTYKMPDELRDALLNLGVEVIIEPPAQPTGASER
jgi:hypothetical protein